MEIPVCRTSHTDMGCLGHLSWPYMDSVSVVRGRCGLHIWVTGPIYITGQMAKNWRDLARGRPEASSNVIVRHMNVRISKLIDQSVIRVWWAFT